MLLLWIAFSGCCSPRRDPAAVYQHISTRELPVKWPPGLVDHRQLPEFLKVTCCCGNLPVVRLGLSVLWRELGQGLGGACDIMWTCMARSHSHCCSEPFPPFQEHFVVWDAVTSFSEQMGHRATGSSTSAAFGGLPSLSSKNRISATVQASFLSQWGQQASGHLWGSPVGSTYIGDPSSPNRRSYSLHTCVSLFFKFFELFPQCFPEFVSIYPHYRFSCHKKYKMRLPKYYFKSW